MRCQGFVIALITTIGLGAASAESPQPGDAPSAALAGLAAGIELGEPTAATLRYELAGRGLAVGASLGSGVFKGAGLQLHADLTYDVLELGDGAMPLYLGVGGRYFRHNYAPVTVDELPDRHVGVRFSAGIAYRMASQGLAFYAEAAPGYDLYRSDGCSLQSGADSLCPHTMSTRTFIQLVIGGRYYFGR